MLALAEYRATLCPGGCGQPLTESTSHWQTGPRYEAKWMTCRACAELHETQRGKAEANPEAAADRMYYVVKSKG